MPRTPPPPSGGDTAGRRRARRARAGRLRRPRASSAIGRRAAADGPCGTTDDTTLTVGLFGTFGFKEAGLWDAYKKVCPNITIKEDVVEQSADYWTRLKTRLASGSGLDDVQAIEIGFVADVVQNHADQFVNWNNVPNAAADKAEFYPGSGSRPRTHRRHRPRSASAPTSARRRSATAATCSSRPGCRPTRRRWPRSGPPGTTSSPSASSTRRPRPSRPARTSWTAPPASSRPPSTRATRPTTTPTASPTSRTATACKNAWELREPGRAGRHHRRARSSSRPRGTRPSPAARSRPSPAPPG